MLTGLLLGSLVLLTGGVLTCLATRNVGATS